MKRKRPKDRFAPVTLRLLEKLSRTKLSSAEWRVVAWIVRWTFGEWDPIAKGRPEFVLASADTVSKATGLPRASAYRAVGRLVDRGIVVRDSVDQNRIGIDEHFSDVSKMRQSESQKWDGKVSKMRQSSLKNGTLTSQKWDGQATQEVDSQQVTGLEREEREGEKKEKVKSRVNDLILTTPDGVAVGSIEDWFREEFWPLYPRKVKRKDALLAIRRVPGIAKSQSTRDAILAGLRRYCVAWRGTEVQHVPHPPSWINARRWEDEISTSTGVATTPAAKVSKADRAAVDAALAASRGRK